MRRALILIVVFVLAQFVQSAKALPPGGKYLYDSKYDVSFNFGGGSAEVDCEVYKYTSESYINKYLYTYRIFNINSGAGLSFFSVAVLNGANVPARGYDLITGAVNPASWELAIDTSSSQVQSVAALFTGTIRDSYSSATLWFVSDHASTAGKGALFGTSAGFPKYATGDLLTPAPEPATLSLFAVGGALTTFVRWRRSN
jgi:hypothetical protein